MTDLLTLAREAAGKVQGASQVGEFITTLPEAENGVETHLFASKLRGYPDWTWAVTTFTDESGTVSVSEVNLLPGESSLLAPKWVPWAERLADYKALQAALEEQAKAEAEEAAESQAAAAEAGAEELDDDADDDIMDVDETDDESLDGEESASGLSDESEDAQTDSDDAGAEPKSFFRYKFVRRHKKRK